MFLTAVIDGFFVEGEGVVDVTRSMSGMPFEPVSTTAMHLLGRGYEHTNEE